AGHVDELRTGNVVPNRRHFRDFGEESMGTNIEAEVFIPDRPREPAHLRVALENAGAVATPSQEVAGGEPCRAGTGNQNAVARGEAPHLSRGFRGVHRPNLPLKFKCSKGYRFCCQYQCSEFQWAEPREHGSQQLAYEVDPGMKPRKIAALGCNSETRVRCGSAWRRRNNRAHHARPDHLD